VSSPTFSGPRALDNGQKVTYVTERAVLELRHDGLTVVEVAPGIDLKRDILARSQFSLQVSDQLKTMDARLFTPERIGLALSPTPPHARIAALNDSTGTRTGDAAAVQKTHS
jgi:acyl CoA:acetate/3-ketoacid CoA transferase